MNTYARLPINLVKGRGAYLEDDHGNQYLDSVTGIGVCSLGHAHPAVSAAIADQASTLIHSANIAGVPLQEELGRRLTGLAGMERAFFCNSGAESLECAFKIARLYGHTQRQVESPRIIVVEGSFHGRTLACLSATGSEKVQIGFEPLVEGFVRVPFDDVAAIEQALEDHQGIVAILVEPILGEGGVVVPDPDYLPQLRAICDQHQLLLIADEVQTGIGKTGAWFACQHSSVLPDVICCAKALGNGVPIGACLARGVAAEVLQPGKHGSTYGGNPLACCAALTVLSVMENQSLCERAAKAGRKLQERLSTGLANNPAVVEVRGKGLMIGIEFNRPCIELKKLALENGLLLNVTRERVVRLLPPLITSDDDLNRIADTVIEISKAFV
jgi:acetylornithine aminotransferase